MKRPEVVNSYEVYSPSGKLMCASPYPYCGFDISVLQELEAGGCTLRYGKTKIAFPTEQELKVAREKAGVLVE